MTDRTLQDYNDDTRCDSPRTVTGSDADSRVESDNDSSSTCETNSTIVAESVSELQSVLPQSYSDSVTCIPATRPSATGTGLTHAYVLGRALYSHSQCSLYLSADVPEAWGEKYAMLGAGVWCHTRCEGNESVREVSPVGSLPVVYSQALLVVLWETVLKQHALGELTRADVAMLPTVQKQEILNTAPETESLAGSDSVTSVIEGRYEKHKSTFKSMVSSPEPLATYVRVTDVDTDTQIIVPGSQDAAIFPPLFES